MSYPQIPLYQARQHLWLPCAQINDHETFFPLNIKKAYGSYIELHNGNKIIDAISSWWCKSLGHGHPRLKEAMIKQIDKFEHVIQADTINETIIEPSRKLTNLTSFLNKVFYAGDGSTAVEIALKMSLHAHKNQGNNKRTKFLALKNGYHGETLGALSVSDLNQYKAPYKEILFDVQFIPDVPYLNNKTNPLWFDCSREWEQTVQFLDQYAETACAIIVEPIVQGVAGMKIYSPDFLKRLRVWSKENNIYLIADEIMTGLGRTGKMLACEHANIEADFICLSKGLTSGWLPFSAVLTTDDIYQLFYDDHHKGKSFLHSNTYCGNPLAASIAIEVLNILKEENLCQKAEALGKEMLRMMNNIAESTGLITNVRGIGAIVAADLVNSKANPRLGHEVYKQAVAMGALLRPLGNTIYWQPPLNTSLNTLDELQNITQKAILNV